MANDFEIILRLTSSTVNSQDISRLLKDFAVMLGWEPSDYLMPDQELLDVTNGHLIVDHGLEQSAVITFLKSPITSLNPEQAKKILTISYNNLIDWHIYVESGQATFVFNRRYSPEYITKLISVNDFESLRSNMFEQITGLSKNPNFPALDNALIENISFWKRNLAAELQGKLNRNDYSNLFNGIIFIRAAEDHTSRITGQRTRAILEAFDELKNSKKTITLASIIKTSIGNVIHEKLSKSLVDINSLSVFNELSIDVCYDLLSSFYKGRMIPYPYDFAIMSKHALSRIYEHYVSLLRFEEDHGQLSFISPLPFEQQEKSFGSVYTPQFIARFFAKYLYLQYPPAVFRQASIFDPACGSGIFLRTLLEYKCAPGIEGISSEDVEFAFNNTTGIDIDENAVQATKLSLALLYLVIMGGKLPTNLNIYFKDTLKYARTRVFQNAAYDIVIANPPFVSFDNQSIKTREDVQIILEDSGKKKPDTYLPFLKIAIDALKPGGFGLFVLPHSFLNKNGDSDIRSYILEQCWIRSLIDLSLIPVFKEKGTYVILLIFQKKIANSSILNYKPAANIVVCNDLVGHALQDYLAGKKLENSFYSIFDVNQEVFNQNEWSKALLPPSQMSVHDKIEKFKPLSEYLELKQGIVTGSDNTFICDRSVVPKGEESVWRPLLRDRDMQRYSMPNRSDYFVFYPIIKNVKLGELEIKKEYPQSWKYLESQISKNKKIDKTEEWWLPHRLRDPQKIFTPKIVTPHLVLIPRFSIDLHGKYAVTRSPYLISKYSDPDSAILKFYLAILNSSIGAWLISLHSDKYSRGYARLEVNTLKSIPVPDPSKVEVSSLNNILVLVNQLIKSPEDLKNDSELDKLIAHIYGLTLDEKILIGFQGDHV